MSRMLRVSVLVGAPALIAGLLVAPSAQATSPAIPGESALDVFYSHDLSRFQWALEAVDARAAHAAGFRGEGVKVAVLDTGVDGTHPDLAGRVLAGVDTSMMASSDDTPVPIEAGVNSDDDGHGTHVSGIIAASDNGRGITGIAPSAEIIPVKVLVQGSGSWEGIAAGIEWAATSGADVINMSLGGAVDVEKLDGSEILCQAIQTAIDNDVVVVVAAGNDGIYGNYLSEPAGCPGVLSVSSISQDGRYSWFSSYDASVSVAGPGMDVISTVPTATFPSGYYIASGTSMASPAVAAVAALAAGAGKDRAAIQDAITTSAYDVGRAGRDALYGYGIASAAGAVGLPTRAPAITERPYLQSIVGPTDKKAVLAWSPPGGTAVNSWEIRSWPSGAVLGTAPDGIAVRGTFDLTLLTSLAGLQVVGLLPDGGEIASPPVSLAASSSGGGGADGSKAVARAKWVADGMQITLQRGDETGPVTVVIYGSSLSSDGFSKEVVIPAGKDSKLIKFKRNDPLRGQEIYLMQYVGSFTLDTIVPPQYAVDVKAKRINREQVVVTGTVWCQYAFEIEVAECLGQPVSIVDRKGRTIGRTSTTRDAYFYYGRATFSEVIRTDAKQLRAHYGKHRSVLANVTPFNQETVSY